MINLNELSDLEFIDLDKPYLVLHLNKRGYPTLFIEKGRDIIQIVFGVLCHYNPYLVENGVRTDFNKPDCTKEDIKKLFADIADSGLDFVSEVEFLGYMLYEPLN